MEDRAPARDVHLVGSIALASPRRVFKETSAILGERPYVHMPVPIARSDDEYFKPLAGLALDRRTEIYLGLIHLQDGVPGARRRMEAAQKYVNHFGLATECGLGRCKTPDVVSCILQLHAEVCASG